MKSRLLSPAVLAATCLAACSSSTVASAAAFVNGSFETATVDPGSSFSTLSNGSTAITGWTVGGDSVDYIGGYWQPQNGGRSLDLSGNANGSVSQTFSTVVGQSYAVNFFLAGNPDGGLGDKTATVSATGASSQNFIFTVTPSDSKGGMGWASYTYDFTATSTDTTLKFASATGTAYGPALDNVSVAAVPEPAIWVMMLTGFAGVGVMLRRRRAALAAAG